MEELILERDVRAEKYKSKYNGNDEYKMGTVITCEDYLLMSFVKLDSRGVGIITREEYLDCLNNMWEEINIHYASNDVCIPILGSGITRIKDQLLSVQEMLDLIIYSYKLSMWKIKKPNKLIIVYNGDELDLNKIDALI